MSKFVTFIQDILMLKNNDSRRVGLSQFREEPEVTVDFSVNKNSILNSDVKLSDLLRKS